MADPTPLSKEVPYHAWELRVLQDVDGRVIEFRQLLPGCADPGPEHFAELTGVTHLLMTVQHPQRGTMSKSIPVRFNIPYGASGVPDPIAAFKVFDTLAEAAQVEAKANLDQKIAFEQRAAAHKIIVAPAGLVPGL